MRIGLSILSQPGHSLWSNGIGQNVLNLALLFEALPFVERVFLIDCGNQKALPADQPAEAARWPVVTLGEVEGQVDVAIEMAGGIDVQWLARLRARGGASIWHICGQPYAGFIEPSIFEKPGYWADAHRADAIWLLPKDADFAPLMRGIHRCPVEIAPYLWSRATLDHSVATHGPEFGYRRGPGEPHRVAVFEPNLSPIKSCLAPMLIADAAHRMRPRAIDRLTLYNTQHLKGQATFDFAVASLDLSRAGKVDVLGREFFTKAMGRADIVLSHQLHCMQNYLYLDALCGGYPLVHNSPLFKEAGYYYPQNDLEAGARQILRAVEEHGPAQAEYARRSARAMQTLDPLDRTNRDAYARLLIKAQDAARGGRRP